MRRHPPIMGADTPATPVRPLPLTQAAAFSCNLSHMDTQLPLQPPPKKKQKIPSVHLICFANNIFSFLLTHKSHFSSWVLTSCFVRPKHTHTCTHTYTQRAASRNLCCKHQKSAAPGSTQCQRGRRPPRSVKLQMCVRWGQR